MERQQRPPIRLRLSTRSRPLRGCRSGQCGLGMVPERHGCRWREPAYDGLLPRRWLRRLDRRRWLQLGYKEWRLAEFPRGLRNIYPLLAKKKKPILIGEMSSAEAGGNEAEWIDQIVPTLRNSFPLIKGLVWFDVNKEADWRISSSPASEAAFIRMANDPYFNR